MGRAQPHTLSHFCDITLVKIVRKLQVGPI